MTTKKMVAAGRIRGSRVVTLRFEDKSDGEQLLVTVSREAVMEMSVNCSDEAVVKFCEFALTRMTP